MIVASLMALAATLAPPVQIDINLWNDLSEDVVVTVPGGTSATAPHAKEADFSVPSGVKTLTIRFKGCDYPMVLPDILDAYRQDGAGPVRLYLSDAVEIYVVPPDLILQTPPGFLDPRQPNAFPVYPGKEICKASQ